MGRSDREAPAHSREAQCQTRRSTSLCRCPYLPKATPAGLSWNHFLAIDRTNQKLLSLSGCERRGFLRGLWTESTLNFLAWAAPDSILRILLRSPLKLRKKVPRTPHRCRNRVGCVEPPRARSPETRSGVARTAP